MAANTSNSLSAQFAGLSQLTSHRQFGIVLGLAVVIALGAALVMWASKPNFIPLYEVEQSDISAARDVLGREGIPWEIDQNRGLLMVAATRKTEAINALSDAQITESRTGGYELLGQALPIGVSNEEKTARLKNMLQIELARTLETFAGVVSAKVIIADGNETSFVRNRQPVTATVKMQFAGNRAPSKRVVDAIVSTVANGVPGLDPTNVAVSDSFGSLTDGGANGDSAQRSEQLEFKRELEQEYRQRIFDMLSSVIGQDRLRASVDAEIDFTKVETASQIYGGDEPAAVLSESIQENESGTGAIGGVPGSLTNQPPADAVVANDLDAIGAAVTSTSGGNQSISRNSTRNFQNDLTVTHTSQPGFAVNNLSISVIVDHKEATGDDGEVTRVPRTPEEIERYASIVRDAVNFDEARGDTLTIESDSFIAPTPIDLAPEEPIWKQPWVLQAVRYLAGGIGVLLLFFMGIKPVLKSLAAIPPPPKAQPAMDPAIALAGGGPAQVLQSQQTAAAEAALGQARKVAADDPKLVAQVVRQWMDNDGK